MLARKRPGSLLGFVLLLLFPAAVFAQNKTITGKVTDSKNAPVAGASVVAKGSTTGTSTNASGDFTLLVPEAINTLVVSSVGFTSIDVDITGKSSVEISLADAATNDLNEVVVIGYGTARKRDLTGSVATVGSKDFNKGVFTAPDQLIQGKAAGVQVLNNSGQPGGGTTVRIRGNSALTGSGQPLYVVDGIPLDGRSSRPGLSGPNLGNSPGTNPLNFLNPADIASMDILKDASATAIYGSRAAYGVVLITTKKGQSGQPKIDFGASVGVSSVMRKIDVLDASQYRAALTYYGAPGTNDKGSSVDAFDEITQKALLQNYNVAISGGNENGRYRLSMSVLDQEGVVKKTGFKKYTANFSSTFKFLESKRLGLDINVIPSQTIEDLAPISNNAGATGSLIGHALQWNPTEALYDANNPSGFNIKAGDIVNPVGMQNAYNDRAKTTTILASISPYFKITNWLEYRLLYSINYGTGNRRASIKQYINLADVLNRGWASIANNELITQQVTHTLNLNREIAPGLNLSALAGFEYMKYTNKGSSMSGFGPSAGGFGQYGLDYTDYIQYSNSTTRNIGSFYDPLTELQSYFGRVGLNYKDKYLLTATIRADGSSKFGADNKYGYFPSAGAAWNISNEEFFTKGFVNTLKLRAGWGKVGNQEFPAGSSLETYSLGNNGSSGQSNNPNPALKWQSDRQYNVGVDFGLMKGRITGSVDYFNKRTTDLLFPTFPIQPAPPGTVVTWKNLDGNIDNSGVEVTINANLVNKKDFSWDLGVFATFLDNKVEGLAAPIFTGELNGQGVSGTFVQTIQNGLPMNAFYTRDFQGIDPQTGQAIYADGGSSFFYVGNPNARTLLGISTTVNYKKLALTINMNGSFGQDVYNNTLNNVINVGSINGGRNIAVENYEASIKEALSNPVTSSSRFIQKGSYMKMANATFSYSLGNVGKSFKGANIFVTGQNLFVLTDFTGFDPEVNVDKNLNGVPSVGIEYTPYPSARTITLGVNFSL
ncbi:MAG: SusC/RagA family TonB-linked outer membrane protein [Chitinophagaceae bacterium]|nr:MAG: SusC/RagA family TonB-linked outer membrane protein [Chitinophagaceae bacterium]